ncbi:nitroreductase [Parvibaculum sp.]|uniref:nitroreductase n=1 Tax=Parvibaculum sp. TaxID=2024848 RepID=UPI002730324A|nr:nitroreductase [Parvibaculum sp.]MDP1628510.1 nitroreductase [Parvibaculum sp.]MDP2151842.1 nitroreductase [Parvibaculum sp.]MDP3326965.1 nitroreductase [Parvibaculum sp.]
MDLDEALKARKSVRAFKPDPVPLSLVNEILELARHSPSGTNIQPWKVHVVTGEVRRRLEAEVLAHRDTKPADAAAEFPRTSKRKEPYTTRMRTLGKEMYGLLGIPKGDQAANWRQWGRNYQFFDAPVGLIFTIDKDLDAMSFLDIGIFMQSIMLAAKSRGLDTCSQGAWNNFWTVTRRVLNVPDDEYIVCGMSLGYADETSPVNTLVAEREPVASFATFHGFE